LTYFLKAKQHDTSLQWRALHLLTILIDADVLRYQLSFKNTKTIKREDEDDGAEVVVAEVINAEKATADLDDYIEELLEKFGTREFLLPLSVSTNFRKGVLPTYKGNRTKPKPALWSAVDGFPTLQPVVYICFYGRQGS
jgi:DNA polymerase-1